MTRGAHDRIADVRRLVDAARALQADPEPLVAPLLDATGLTPEGVRLALARHLETSPSDAELASLVAAAGDAAQVTVILSANVFVAALRAIALARAAAADVVVRPSRREPWFARALVAKACDPAIRLVDDVDVATIDRGEIHVYGRDATIAAVRAAARVPVRGHGAGMGIAVVTHAAPLDAAAAALADDVVPFDQRGCLSPRVAFVEGDHTRASLFAGALDAALARAQAAVPRGALDDDERAEARRYVSALAFAGEVHAGTAHVVGVARAEAPLVVPPPGRHVHVAPISALESIAAALGPLARFVVTVGADDLARVAPHAPPHARVAALGAMQRPPLDGPVDRRP